MPKENKLADMSLDFAVMVLHFTDGIHGHHSLVNQLERAGTSIGANIREAKYAQSPADFASKLQIALKECYESEYWLELFEKSGIATAEAISPLITLCKQIRYLLVASLNTVKSHSNS